MSASHVVTAWEFGSRGGSVFACCLFATLFGVLGWGISRQLRRRLWTAGVARGLGVLVFVGPLVMVYASSLGGFYEAEVDGTVLRLRYLLPVIQSEIRLADVSAIDPVPWYRGRWRLRVIARSGDRYESATWHRAVIVESALRLRQRLAERAGG